MHCKEGMPILCVYACTVYIQCDVKVLVLHVGRVKNGLAAQLVEH